MKDKMINIVDAALKMEFDFVPLQKSIEMTEMLMQAEVRPVRHGQWRPSATVRGWYYCSYCLDCRSNRTKYCPNCGAKMDLGED